MAKKTNEAGAQNSGKNKVKRGPGNPDKIKPFQFKPGQSGNPGGRPKKKPFTEAIFEVLNENPGEAKAAILGLFSKAKEGDSKAFNALADRAEGKVLQGVRLEGELGLTTEEERKQRVIQMLREGAQRVEKVQ